MLILGAGVQCSVIGLLIGLLLRIKRPANPSSAGSLSENQLSENQLNANASSDDQRPATTESPTPLKQDGV